MSRLLFLARLELKRSRTSPEGGRTVQTPAFWRNAATENLALMAEGGHLTKRLRSLWPFAAVLLAFLAASAVTWRQPVTTMPMNRNDASFYLVLAHNLVDHGVYSHHQSEPFAPHTEWPPGVPRWYAVPMSVVGQFPLGSSAWIIHAWTWLTAALAAWLVFRYLRLFCSDSVAVAITAATIFSRAFLDECQAAFADIPALAASFSVLFEIERHFASESPSRWRHAGLLVAMSLLPIMKPYLGVVFVAYLWKLFSRHVGWALLPVPSTETEPGTGKSAHPTRLVCGIALVGLCCLPFVAFMTYSVLAARDSGTISAVTWLTTDNAVAQREGIAAVDPKTLGEWASSAVATARFHLINHVAASPLPLLDRWGLSDWPLALRWSVTGSLLALFAIGVFRSLRQREAAAAAYLVSMLAVFAVLGCDSARYFVILTPLCAWMIWQGLTVLLARRDAIHRFAPAAVIVLALGSGFAWSRERQAATFDGDPLFQDVYAALFELRNRDDVTTLAVPSPLRELAIVETGKRIVTHDELLNRSDSELNDVAVLVVEQISGRAASFGTPTGLADLLTKSNHSTMIGYELLRVRRWRAGGRQSKGT